MKARQFEEDRFRNAMLDINTANDAVFDYDLGGSTDLSLLKEARLASNNGYNRLVDGNYFSSFGNFTIAVKRNL